MMERLRRFPRQRIPLLVGGLALLFAFSSAVGISFTPAVRSALLPVRASNSTPVPSHVPTRAPIVTTGPVRVLWGDSTALAGWNAMPGAAGYRVTLIRANDMAIMEQVDVPATQLRFDAQGIWPDNHYVVAVQALDDGKHPGAPIYSGAGQSVPFVRETYNGFLDTMNIAKGPIDHNLWDQRGYISDVGGEATFINAQIHGHIETGQIAYEQALTGISPRTAFDFAGRTGHIHGEVDFHGDLAEWFSVILAPRHIGPDEMADSVDRSGPTQIPLLELFNQKEPNTNGPILQLIEALPGQEQRVLGSYTLPMSYVNVRNTLDWYVSAGHAKVVVDGVVAFDTDLPVTLPFSRGYLTLAAQSYPKIDEDHLGGVTSCDRPGGECTVWHIDNWGFDAPAGQMPAITANYDTQCSPPGDAEILSPACDQMAIGTSVTAQHVHVADANNTASALVVFDAFRTIPENSLQVRVNGGAWQTAALTAPKNGWLDRVLQVPVPAGALKTGDNLVEFRTTQPMSDGASVANTVIEQTRTFAYTPPPLPPEPAPIGTWAASIPGAHQ